MSISRAAEEEVFSVDPIIHIMAVLSLLYPADPFVSLLLGDVRLRLAPKSSGSGELTGELCLLMLTSEVTALELAMEPNELLANRVPFLGGLPILFPLLENLVPPLVGLTGPLGELVAGTLLLALLLSVSILSGFPDPLFKGMILAGESFSLRIGGMVESLGPKLSLALKS